MTTYTDQQKACIEAVTVPRASIEWLNEHYPALCEKSGLCERIGGRLYTKTLATPAPDAAAAQGEPVATLHDDGHYTWHGAKPHDFNYAGWRMNVYAAPSQAVLDAKTVLEVKASLWDEVRSLCVPHGAGVDKPITEWLAERLSAAPTPVADSGAMTENDVRVLLIRHANSCTQWGDDDSLASVYFARDGFSKFVRALLAAAKPVSVATDSAASVAERCAQFAELYRDEHAQGKAVEEACDEIAAACRDYATAPTAAVDDGVTERRLTDAQRVLDWMGRHDEVIKQAAFDELVSVFKAARSMPVHTIGGVPVDHSNDVTITLERYEQLLRDASMPERKAVTNAARGVLAERERQVTVEGWTPEHDDMHKPGELALNGSCYAFAASQKVFGAGNVFDTEPPTNWTWSAEWWKPGTPRRMLEKAAALILAEIERIDRATATSDSATPKETGEAK